MSTRKLAPLTVCGALSACLSTTALERTTPTLDELSFTAPEVQTGLAIELVVVLARAESLSEHQFIPVMISSGGHSQEVHLRTQQCTSPQGTPIVCNQIVVTIHSDRSIGDLDGTLAEIDGQFVHVRPDFSLLPGGTILFFSGDLFRALDRVAADPAVRLVDLNHIEYPGGFNPASAATAGIRTATSASPRHDDLLHITSGSQVVATYTQPDGSTLQAAVHVQ